MVTPFPLVPIRKVVIPVERPEEPIVGKIYRQIGVRLWGQGAYERESLDGGSTQYKTLSRVEADDIIVNKIWARNGSVAVVPATLSGCFCSGEFPTYAPIQEKLLPAWFHWITKTKYFWQQCDEKSQGTSGKNRIRPEQFLSVEIPLPPLDEQRRIVARIEALAARVREALDLRARAVEETEVTINSLIAQLIKENKARWKFGVIPDFAQVNPSRKGMINLGLDDLVSFVPMSAVDEVTGTIAQPQIRPFEEVSKGYTWFTNGDVIFARITPCMENGKAAIAENLVNGVGFGSTEFHVIRPSEKMLAAWIHILMRSHEFRKDAAAHFTGTAGQQRVPQSFLENKIVPVPSLSEQEHIITYVDSIRSKLSELRRLQAETQKELAALLPSILDQAFRGEL